MDNKNNIRVLVVAPDLVRPDVSSGELRLFEFLKLLSQHAVVDFWGARWVASESRGAAEYVGLLQGQGINVLPSWSGNVKIALSYRVYHVVICEFWFTTENVMKSLRRIQPWATLITDTVDVAFLREEAGMRIGVGDPGQIANNKKLEIEAYRHSQALIVITKEDELALNGILGIPRSFLIPNLSLTRDRPQIVRRKELLFIGGFSHFPNRDGLLWFVLEVFPLIRMQEPEVRLLIVGSHASEEIRDLGNQAGIEFVGQVPETAPYLDRAAVSIAPLRFGAGMKGKVTEAMGAGVPVVTTTIGAQGLNARSGEHLLIADNPTEFAAAVTWMLADPKRAARVGTSGRDLIESVCGRERVVRTIDEIFSSGLINDISGSAWLKMIPHQLFAVMVRWPRAEWVRLRTKFR